MGFRNHRGGDRPVRVAGPFAGLHTFDSLRIRGYRLLWLGQLGTSMGFWMDQVSRGWLMYQLTGSAFDLGLVSALRSLPMLVLGLFAGVLADRYSKRNQLMIAQSVNAGLNVVLAVLITTGQVQSWHLYVSAFIMGCAQSFQIPARQAMVCDLVGRDRLLNAISLSSAVVNLSCSVGPAVAGLVITFFGVDGSYYIQALVYLWATLWTYQIKVPPRTAPEPDAPVERPVGMFTSFAEGIRYVVSTPVVLSVLLVGLIPTLLGAPYQSLIPVFAHDVLRVGAAGQGLLLTAVGIGALLGALSLASLGRVKRTGLTILGGQGLFALTLLAFSRSTHFPLSLGVLLFTGITSVTYNSQAQTAVQMLPPARLRGRVVSVYMLNQALGPAGALLAGTLATVWDAPTAVALMGASCFLLAVAAAIGLPALRRLNLAEEVARLAD